MNNVLNNSNKKVTVITGPTGSKKSQFSINLAKKLNAVIINADLMQMYSDLKILTASPTEEEMNEVPHIIFGILDFNQKINAYDWLLMVEKIIKESDYENFIIVGGTTMYINVIINGIVNIPKIEKSLEDELFQKFLSDQINFYLYSVKIDPLIYGKIHPNHRSRIIRAVAVKIQTGRSIFDWYKNEQIKPSFQVENFFITKIPREKLYELINSRVNKMVEFGVLEEIKNFNQKKGKCYSPLENTIGYKEFTEFLNYNLKFSEAVEKAKQASRNYAKRQITWNKHQYKNYKEIEIN